LLRSLAVWPDQQLAEYVRQLEAQASKPVTAPAPVTTPVQTVTPTAVAPSFTGTGKATGKQKELTFVINQAGNRVTGTYTMQVPMQGSNRESFNGQFEGGVSGNRATGSWRDAKEKEGIGTFELTMAPGGRSFTAVLKGGVTTERYTVARVGAASSAGTGTPPSSAPPVKNLVVTAEITNRSNANAHIFVQGESFGPGNKYGPGEKRRVQVAVQPNGSVTFTAGKDGRVIATKNWQGGPSNLSRIPAVVFDESNPYDKLVISTGLR
jgi:hypothetical protein